MLESRNETSHVCTDILDKITMTYLPIMQELNKQMKFYRTGTMMEYGIEDRHMEKASPYRAHRLAIKAYHFRLTLPWKSA